MGIFFVANNIFNMRIASSFFLMGIMQLYAVNAYTQDKKLTINFSDTEIRTVLYEIEKLSGYYFLFNEQLLDAKRKVTIITSEKTITEVLDILFKDTNTKYSIFGVKVVLAPDFMGEELVAENRFISGIVRDINNQPISNVNVVVTGIDAGTFTDNSGRYSINIPEGSKSLTFSFVGMESQTAYIGDLTEIDVTMTELPIDLDEVVVVGYGVAKVLTVTGAVSTIRSRNISSVSNDNLATNLSGKLSGLRVTQRTGEPGSYNTLFDIRGFGTPLIVVDGIVVNPSDFVRINPDDIDQITILKDASAALYGIQAANGVIFVTTKRGAVSKPVISYTGSYIISKFINLPQVCDAYEFATLTTQSEINSGRSPNTTTYTPQDLEKFKDGTFPSTNWFNLVTRSYTNTEKHNASISGGNEKIKYYTSLGYINETGLWKSGDLRYKKLNLRSVISGKITSNLETELKIEGMLDDKQSVWPVQSTFEALWMHALPTIPVYANNNPDYFQSTIDGLHPVAMTTAKHSGYAKTKNHAFQGSFSMNYQVPFIKGLDAKLMISLYIMDQYTKRWNKKYFMYTYDPLTDKYNNTASRNVPSKLTGIYSPSNRSSMMGQINYKKIILKDHILKASLVFEGRHDHNDNIQASKEFSIDIDQFYAGISNPTVTSGNIAENTNQNIIGRLNYDFLSKYLLEVGFNYGGSSKFPEGNRWSFFPYLQGGWRVSEEQYFENIAPEISSLKIRCSYGKMGDDGASSFQFLTGYNYPSGNYVFNDKIVSGLTSRGMPNPYISWFTVTSKNIGFDAVIKKGFNMQFDLFQRNRSGLLATRVLTIPGTVGANLPQENLNKDVRKGVELVFGYMSNHGNLNYEFSSNMAYSRGKMTYIERRQDGNSFLNWKNNVTDRWTNITWGYNYIGQFMTQEEINTSPVQDSQGNRTLKPGDLKYEDINSDGLVTADDQIPVGRSNIPDMTFALSGSIRYKEFDLSFLFQGASYFNLLRTYYNRGPLPWNRNNLNMFMDNWHHEDIYDVNSPWVPGRFPSASTNGTPPSNSWVSQFWMENGRYLRLKSMEIGLTLNDQIAAKLNLENLRVYLSGFNLVTWTGVRDFDPELATDNSHPLTRDIILGISIAF